MPSAAQPSALKQPSAHRHGSASLTVTIPNRRRHRGHHAATISPLTRSIVIVVNGGTPKIFDTTPSSPGCTSGAAGTTCTLGVTVPYGSDTFAVSTHSGKGGTGFLLDQASVTVTVTNATAQVAITLGPVFSSTKDSGPGSLREAIADANAGDTIAYVGTTPARIKLRSGIELTKNVTIAGPGASNMTIAGDGTFELLLVDGITASISGLTLTNGNATSGGAIGNNGALTLSADTFHANGTIVATPPPPPPAQRKPAYVPHVTVVRRGRHAPRVHRSVPRPPAAHRHAAVKPSRAQLRPHRAFTGLGGAIYNSPGATLTVTNDIFTGNATGASGAGGAIFSSAGSTLSVSGSTFLNNAAEDGGALYTESASATITNDTFNGNNGVVGDPAGQGGAIFSGADVTISSCTFTSNIAGDEQAGADSEGGAIYQNAGSLAAAHDTFTSNVAGGGTGGSYGYGGAVYYGATGTATLDSDDFEMNQSGGDAYGYGGAVYAQYAITATNDTFAKNAAFGTAGDAYGGAFYAEQAVTISASTFTSNTATGTGTSGSAAAGGALVTAAAATLTTVTFSQNTATGATSGAVGGGADFEGANTTLTGVTFSANMATASGLNAFSEGGGAASNGTATFSNTSFDSNVATTSASVAGYGGGICIFAPASFTGTVTNNTAAEQGGGVDLEDVVTVTNSTISGNRVPGAAVAGDGGGGIYDDDTLTLATSAVFGNNTSGTNAGGGGIFGNGTLTVTNSTISGNTATSFGGGIGNVAGVGVSLTNVTVFENSTPGGSGGNIKNSGIAADLAIANSIVAGGVASTGSDISNDGTIESGDYNIIQTAVAGNAPTGPSSHNQTVNPLLGPLANNGGPTQTNAEDPGSPSIESIPLGVCTAAGITVDQRGFPRGHNGNNLCDAGAFEFQ